MRKNELKKKGIFISPGGVRSVWLRHELETFPKRFKALEAKIAQEEFILLYGKTPMQTFRDTIHLAREKMIGYSSETEV